MTVAGGIPLYHQRLERGREPRRKAEKRRAKTRYRQRLEREKEVTRDIEAAKTQAAKRASEHNRTTRLLSLPGEIRNHIYAMVFYDEDGSDSRYYASILPLICATGGIVQTCKQLRAEGRSHFIGHCNILAVECPTPIADIHSDQPFTSVNEFPRSW